MNDPGSGRILGMIWLFPLLIIGPMALEFLFKLGGKPVVEGTTIHYRTKPLMRGLVWLAVAGAMASAWFGIDDMRVDSFSSCIALVFAIALIIGAAMFLGEIVLDDEGIHCHNSVLRDRSIPWRDLDYFEVQNESNWRTSVSSKSYVFRSVNGETVGASSMMFDVEDLLRRIRERHACPEKPMQVRQKTMFKSAAVPHRRSDRPSRSNRN
jgi:hypothetical protein